VILVIIYSKLLILAVRQKDTPVPIAYRTRPAAFCFCPYAAGGLDFGQIGSASLAH